MSTKPREDPRWLACARRGRSSRTLAFSEPHYSRFRGVTMKHSVVALISVAFSLTVLVPESVLAGPYSDEMAKCLVKSTSEADKNSLVKWMFAAAALHPAVKSIASVSDAQRGELNKSTAKLFERLITESCRAEAQEAVKYEGPSTIDAGFQVLGQVAARGLFADPSVARNMAELGNHMDKQKIQRIFGPTQ